METWRREYNGSRPHGALGEETPNEFANEIAISLGYGRKGCQDSAMALVTVNGEIVRITEEALLKLGYTYPNSIDFWTPPEPKPSWTGAATTLPQSSSRPCDVPGEWMSGKPTIRE